MGNDCNAACATTECNDDHVNAWDEGVAFYVGSVTKMSYGKSGHFPYTLAEKRCANFGTCDGEAGEAHVNRLLFDEFNKGQAYLMAKQCAEAQVVADRIIDLMAVPLVQGT